MSLWFTNLLPYLFLILFHLYTPKHQYPSTGIDSQTSVDKPKAFDYYCLPNAPFGPVHFTEYPQIGNSGKIDFERMNKNVNMATFRFSLLNSHFYIPTVDFATVAPKS
ncbi:hypothetical protein DSO57_1014655 [Entomophthora muscae]|uniref:Uncharacterized protein n=1 Tax=Entomophthora muscae TaxID=34485 RepID=A0ACC2S7B2_9FUNG|nr:hypothetical protein DSO57_1014655 [Entomophthora muscae]